VFHPAGAAAAGDREPVRAADSAEIPAVNPQVGNYATAMTDATVAVAGPALAVTRTYNSQDLRTDGAFGAGWSTPWDQKIVSDGDGSGNVVVTLASGREARFGQNPNGSYAPPPGQHLDLTVSAGVWTLRDPSGTRWQFSTPVGGSAARLASVTDADGRVQSYAYSGAQLSTVTDVASGRALRVSWTGGRISSVTTDAPASGQSVLTWTYAYTSGKLTNVCTPLGAGSCTGYTYTNSSHYRSVVLDDGPSGYWPLGEASGTIASNVAARSAGQYDGAYSGVTLGATGALQQSPDKAATFSGSIVGHVARGLVSSNQALAIELWFKANAGATACCSASRTRP
jgi:YD repeat-containing protein